jgi:hypothetical protein
MGAGGDLQSIITTARSLGIDDQTTTFVYQSSSEAERTRMKNDVSYFLDKIAQLR